VGEALCGGIAAGDSASKQANHAAGPGWWMSLEESQAYGTFP
jgi:hypothetical protein